MRGAGALPNVLTLGLMVTHSPSLDFVGGSCSLGIGIGEGGFTQGCGVPRGSQVQSQQVSVCLGPIAQQVCSLAFKLPLGVIFRLVCADTVVHFLGFS